MNLHLLFTFRLPLLKTIFTFSPKRRESTVYQDKIHIPPMPVFPSETLYLLCHGKERGVTMERENICRYKMISHVEYQIKIILRKSWLLRQVPLSLPRKMPCWAGIRARDLPAERGFQKTTTQPHQSFSSSSERKTKSVV